MTAVILLPSISSTQTALNSQTAELSAATTKQIPKLSFWEQRGRKFLRSSFSADPYDFFWGNEGRAFPNSFAFSRSWGMESRRDTKSKWSFPFLGGDISVCWVRLLLGEPTSAHFLSSCSHFNFIWSRAPTQIHMYLRTAFSVIPLVQPSKADLGAQAKHNQAWAQSLPARKQLKPRLRSTFNTQGKLTDRRSYKCCK